MLLEIRNLVKRFDGLTVIDDVSFAVPAGQRTALIGPNGAGKTMMFNLITGVYTATGGTIRLGGLELTQVPAVARIRHGLARTFQNVRLVEHLTALENVMVGQHHRARRMFETVRLRGNRWMEEAREALRTSGLARYADIAVRQLPFGVRKQVELARALIARPKLLLLDEPAAGLNPTERNQLRAELERIARDGVTLLVIEHDMAFVGDLCDAVVVLNFGRKIAEGTPQKVRQLAEVREAYLGMDADA